MSTQNDTTRSYAVNAAMSAFRRVVVSTNGSIGLAGSTVVGVGVLQADVTANSYESAVVRMNGVGTQKASIASGGVPATANDTLYAAANGQVSNTGTVVVGVLIENADTANTIVEYVPSTVA